jgi:predicted alpha/beta-hydrolase family hydrolase
VANAGSVSALAQIPEESKACLVLAHGAGAGMEHSFMRAIADGLADLGIATLRYQFPYMEAGSKRPDRPPVAHAAVRAAVATAKDLCPGKSLFAGGKSFGARMTSQAQALQPLEGVRGLVFLGFPLHPAGKASVDRADHLSKVDQPMLFVQGTRDELADFERMAAVVEVLGAAAAIEVVDGGDHSFHVLKRSGRTDREVLEQVCHAVSGFVGRLA